MKSCKTVSKSGGTYSSFNIKASMSDHHHFRRVKSGINNFGSNDDQQSFKMYNLDSLVDVQENYIEFIA